MSTPYTILLKLAFRLTLCHLPVGSQVETETEILSHTALPKVYLKYFCICSMV